MNSVVDIILDVLTAASHLCNLIRSCHFFCCKEKKVPWSLAGQKRKAESDPEESEPELETIPEGEEDSSDSEDGDLDLGGTEAVAFGSIESFLAAVAKKFPQQSNQNSSLGPQESKSFPPPNKSAL